MSVLQVNTINEVTSANGVTIDGLSLKDGNVVPAAGKGIDFSNQTANSGMDLEVLDHYEEGEYQVTSLSTTGGGTVGILGGYDMLSYIRIGSMVTVGGGLIVSGVLSGTDGALKFPLPFVVKSKTDSAAEWVGSAQIFYVNTDSGTLNLTPRVVGSNSYCDLVQSKDNAASASIYGSSIASNSRINITISYITT